MILVVGATGQLGSKVVRGLLAKRKPVRILARPASAYQPLADLGAQVAFGDLTDPPSLAAACQGIDTVVSTANSARRGGADNVETVDSRGTQNLIDAAAAVGVRHFIYVSVLGVNVNSPVPFLAAKARSEEQLRASGMKWTILAPNAFMESWPARVIGIPASEGRPATIIGEGRARHMFVAEDDVAAFILAAVDNPDAHDRHVPIGGPQPLSWIDVAAIYERVLGRKVDLVHAAPGQPVPGIPPPVLPILAALDTYETVFDTGVSAGAFGVALTPLEDVARRQVAAAGTR
jgi:uncharacterized protein YbjT (DUF2867 family)